MNGQKVLRLIEQMSPTGRVDQTEWEFIEELGPESHQLPSLRAPNQHHCPDPGKD